MNAEPVKADTDRAPAPLHAAVIAALLPHALHRPASEGVRIVALWWFDQLRQARVAFPAPGALEHARVASDRLLFTLSEHQNLLRDAKLTREWRHLGALNLALAKVCDERAGYDWLQQEAPLLTADARDEAAHFAEAHADSIEKRTGAVAGALAKHFDRTAASFPAALASFTVSSTIGSALNADAFARHVHDALARSARNLKESIEGVQAADNRRSFKRMRCSLEALRAILSPFVPEVPQFTPLYHSVTGGRVLVASLRSASRLAKRAERDGFGALAAALLDIRQSHYNALVLEWLEDQGARALARVPEALAALNVSPEDAASGSADAPAGVPLEIERKFLLTGCPPEAAEVPGTRIEQGWMPGRTLRERLRRSVYATGVTRYTRTVKFGHGLSRVELEEDTDRSVFEALWPLTAGARVRKTRHAIREGAFTWEVDVFSDRNLVLAEVELRSEHDSPALPSWLAPWVVRDVTGEAAYINANLATANPETDAAPVASTH